MSTLPGNGGDTVTQMLLPPRGLSPHPAPPTPMTRLMARLRRNVLWIGLAALTAVGVYTGTNSPAPLRMGIDYPRGAAQGVGTGEWPVGKPAYFVFPIPSFNHPVLIRDVELVTVGGDLRFDHPSPYLLPLTGGGYQLANPTGDAPPPRVALDHFVLYKAPAAGLVIPVTVRTPGCRDAVVVLRVLDLTDGHVHTVNTRWEIALSTGISHGHGFGGCA